MYLHDGTYAGWAAVKSGADTVGDFAVCRDNEAPCYLHASAVNTLRGGLGNATILRSTDLGRTWAETQHWNDGLGPSFSTGAGGSVYYTAADATLYPGSLYMVYNRLYGGGSWHETDVWPDSQAVNGPVVAAPFTTPDSEAVI